MSKERAGALRGISDRTFFCGALVACLSLGVNCAVVWQRGVPAPRVQDEFSYLLAGDTFARGRLTNPTPAFAEHFETPHVLVRPTYMSKYPPGQGIALALGEWIGGQPIAGVWLSAAAGCAAIYWMMLGFVGRPFALVGGILAAVHPQLVAWGQNYWGGWVALMGGAILIGACGRLVRAITFWNSILLGVGLVILANSRPYEGLVFCGVPILMVIFRARGRAPETERLNQRWPLVAGLALILVPAAIGMMYYNFRVTGHALRMPFVEYSRQYDVYPKFWFLAKHETPAYSSAAAAEIHTVYERGDFDRLQTARGVMAISAERVWEFVSMYTRSFWLLAPMLVGAIFVGRKMGWIWATLGVFVLGLCAETWFMQAYSAPAGAVMLLLIVVGAEWWWNWTSITRVLCGAMLVVWLGFAIVSAAAPLPADAQRFGREDLIAEYPQLQKGKHIIFVEYEAGHLIHDEWVYNPAVIFGERVVWARSLGQVADEEMMRAFPDREDWLVRVNGSRVVMDRYR